MRSIVRPLLIPVIAAALFMVATALPAAAECVVSSGSLASGASINVTAPAGHNYRFDYSGAATGSISIPAGTSLNIVNGTGGVLNYVIFDEQCGLSVPALDEWMLALLALMLAGLGVQRVWRRR